MFDYSTSPFRKISGYSSKFEGFVEFLMRSDGSNSIELSLLLNGAWRESIERKISSVYYASFLTFVAVSCISD